MRSSLLPRRPLRRVCDACKQQLSLATPKNASHVAGITTIAKSAPVRPITELRPAACRTQRSRNSTPQTRSISSSSPRPAESRKPEEEAAEKPRPQSNKTYYDLFPQTLPQGPPPKGPFAVDARALRREFLTLQAAAHPDVAAGAGASAASRRAADAASARINEAYRTLASALPRAQYLLQLRGRGDVSADETARVSDPALLAAVLEAREAVEEAEGEKDLDPLREANDARVALSEDRLARAFEGDELERAAEEVTRLRYWLNIRESIHNWERGKPVVLEH
ncbi:Co-chaperone Hsc20 [Hypoxylon sp. FL1284]|nr:Co-chaperone Hsc20 [Hypoxylon sp. FL1284]